MRPLLMGILALAIATRATHAEDTGANDAKWKEAMQAYKDDIKKKSIRFKKRAIEALPPSDERTITFIIEDEKLLSSRNWWIRITAAEQLGKIRDPDLRAKLLAYAKNPDVKVREGIMAAVAVSNDRLDVPVIVEGLRDPRWEVRRMACWAAGQQRAKEAVEPMIAMLHWVDPRTGAEKQKGETHPRVRGVLLFNLEEITGKTDIGCDAGQWRQYWDRNKDKTLPPRLKRFDVGDFGEVKGIEYNDTFARRGAGPLTIVLPEANLRTVYYMPYLSQWTFVKWFFVNLPPIKSFPEVKYNVYGDPIYPVGLLVDAFEDIRKKQNQEKMILAGHGFTCWVAAKYAQKYPEHVQGLILLDPYAQDDTYTKAVHAAKRSGDPDAEFWGKVSSYELRAVAPLEIEVYDYVTTTYFLGPKNRDDIEAGILQKVWDDPNGTWVQVSGEGADFDIRDGETSRVPTLIFVPGKDNELMAHDDLERLRRYYTRNSVVDGGDKFAYLPFMEQPDMFEQGLRLFIDKKIE
jgi:pimeloyl-ACP methyl ester carboxylesterase